MRRNKKRSNNIGTDVQGQGKFRKKEIGFERLI